MGDTLYLLDNRIPFCLVFLSCDYQILETLNYFIFLYINMTVL